MHDLTVPVMTDTLEFYMTQVKQFKLLSREEERALAQKIERGNKILIKALSKTRLVLNEVVSLEKKLRQNPERIRVLFDINEEELSEKDIEEKAKSSKERTRCPV